MHKYWHPFPLFVRAFVRQKMHSAWLLRQAPQTIKRSTLEEQQLPSEFSVGIPLQLLSNRPDVKAAEMALANTYYNTNSARAAFYPQITISGSAGWTNSAGSMIVNPGKLLASALGSLTQPLFYRGSNIAPFENSQSTTGRSETCLSTVSFECLEAKLVMPSLCIRQQPKRPLHVNFR